MRENKLQILNSERVMKLPTRKEVENDAIQFASSSPRPATFVNGWMKCYERFIEPLTQVNDSDTSQDQALNLADVNGCIDTDFELIPMHEISDLSRDVAVRWLDCEEPHWIGNKHKLASDIMRYADLHLKTVFSEAEKEIAAREKESVPKGNNYNMIMAFYKASEKLPERNEYVLIRTRFCKYPCVVGRFNGVKWLDTEGHEMTHAIEWSPLYNR